MFYPQFMKKIIIFDFNRTIYDPDSERLIKDARFVLQTLRRRGFMLYLISRAGKARRELIKNMKIEKYFCRIITSKEKSRRDFEKIVKSGNIDRNLSFVVGDFIREEILIGNSLGLQTIWFKAGKFVNEKPRNKNEKPKYIVSKLRDILDLVG